MTPEDRLVHEAPDDANPTELLGRIVRIMESGSEDTGRQ